MLPRLALFVAALALALAGPTAAQERSLEYPVKAAFLYQFGSFVEWPPGALPDNARPIQICVVGHDPFGADLDRLVRGQTIGGRQILLRRIPTISPQSGCHIAYLGGSAEQSVATAGHAIASEPVLTVADTAASGVVVQFLVRANRVRFRIDLRAASAGRLRVSSKLLNLALEVAQ
jgi:hypothetical protein